MEDTERWAKECGLYPVNKEGQESNTLMKVVLHYPTRGAGEVPLSPSARLYLLASFIPLKISLITQPRNPSARILLFLLLCPFGEIPLDSSQPCPVWPHCGIFANPPLSSHTHKINRSPSPRAEAPPYSARHVSVHWIGSWTLENKDWLNSDKGVAKITICGISGWSFWWLLYRIHPHSMPFSADMSFIWNHSISLYIWFSIILAAHFKPISGE